MELVCVKPEISSYNFMRYLCAALVKQHKVIINAKSIVEHIYNFKQQNKKLQYMFEDIEFRKSINNVVSSDISENIGALKTFGVIRKINPKNEKLFILLTTEEAEDILGECTPEIKGVMEQLATTFTQIL